MAPTNLSPKCFTCRECNKTKHAGEFHRNQLKAALKRGYSEEQAEENRTSSLETNDASEMPIREWQMLLEIILSFPLSANSYENVARNCTSGVNSEIHDSLQEQQLLQKCKMKSRSRHDPHFRDLLNRTTVDDDASKQAPLCIECGYVGKSAEAIKPVGLLLDPETGMVLVPQDILHLQKPRIWVSDPAVATSIEGLAYFPGFLSEDEEKRIMEVVEGHEWTKAVRRPQQFYGTIYYHTTHEEATVQPEAHRNQGFDLSEFQFLIDKFLKDPRLHDLFAGQDRETVSAQDPELDTSAVAFPEQILVNEYRQNFGISSHFEDETAFGDVIATLSLLNPIYMTLEKPVERTNACSLIEKSTKVLLEPRSLMIMARDARFAFRHGISRHYDVPQLGEGGNVTTVKRDESYRRISLTIRHLKQSRRQVST